MSDASCWISPREITALRDDPHDEEWRGILARRLLLGNAHHVLLPAECPVLVVRKSR
jgi:hypothetical protein